MVVIGNCPEDFLGISEFSLPIIPFRGSEEDACLDLLSHYLLNRILPSEDIAATISEDIKAFTCL